MYSLAPYRLCRIMASSITTTPSYLLHRYLSKDLRIGDAMGDVRKGMSYQRSYTCVTLNMAPTYLLYIHLNIFIFFTCFQSLQTKYDCFRWRRDADKP